MVYVISDTHIDGRMYNPDSEGNFRHAWQYQNPNYVDEILENWRRTVDPADVVIHVGDVIGSRFNQKHLSLFKGLPGYKILVKGNHDVASSEKWLTVFNEVHEKYFVQDGIIYSHYPFDMRASDYEYNIYGHLHEYPKSIRHSIIRSYKKYYSFQRNIPFVLSDMLWSPVTPEKIITRCVQVYEKMLPADMNI